MKLTNLIRYFESLHRQQSHYKIQTKNKMAAINNKLVKNKRLYFGCLKQTIAEYLSVSSIQGLKYIQDKKSNLIIK